MMKKKNYSVEFCYHRFQDQHELGKQKQLPPARNSSAYQQQNFKNRSLSSFLFSFFQIISPFYFILFYFLVFMFHLGFGYFLMCSLWEIGSSRKNKTKRRRRRRKKKLYHKVYSIRIYGYLYT